MSNPTKEDNLMDEILKATNKKKIEEKDNQKEIDFNQVKKLPPPKSKRRHHKSKPRQRIQQQQENSQVIEKTNSSELYSGYDTL